MAVEAEAGTRDAVGVATRDRPEMRAAGLVIGEIREAQDHVRDPAGTVRHVEAADDAAVIEQLQPEGAPREGVPGHGAAILQTPDELARHVRLRARLIRLN